MAKKNNLIQQMKYLQRKAEEITPSVYASIAIPLVENYGWTAEQVAELFSISQEVWQENCEQTQSMLQHCEELTGIDLRVRITE